METRPTPSTGVPRAPKPKIPFFDRLVPVCVIVFLLILASELLGALLVLPLTLSGGRWSTLALYLSCLGGWIVFLTVMLAARRDRPMLSKLSLRARPQRRLLLLGLAVGAGLNALCALAALLHGDIRLTYRGEDAWYLLLALLAVLIQSGSEELACRLFLYERLRRSHRSPLWALLGSSLLFALLHIFNPGVTALSLLNIALSGALLALMVYYFDALWFAIAFHTLWNFTQNFLLGLPNSGLTIEHSLLRLDAPSAQSSFFYDVGFGVEGSGIAAVVLALAIAAVILLGERKRRAAKG